MNILDSIIGFVSPKWGSQRSAWRKEQENLRNYDAGNYDRLNRNWVLSNMSAEMTDRNFRDTIRARSRDLERNSDIAQGVLLAVKRNVIGSGFTLQAKTKDNELNDQLESLWKEWCKSKNCDVTGQQSFVDMCRMAVVRRRVDGGILFLKRYTDGGVVPFSLQAIEVDELDSSQLVGKNKKNIVMGGIEYNSYGRPVGYWIKEYSVDGITPTKPIFVEAKDVIFYWQKTRPSQLREMSPLAPTLTRVRDINQFMEAVSVKERIAACLAVFIKKVNPGTGYGRNGGTTSESKNSYDNKTVSPGMIRELNIGEEIATVTPPNQAQSAADFIRLQQRLVGAGQGLSYETVSRDMSQVNYSSARQGLIEDELTYTEEQQLLKEKFMSEVYETFVISALLSGQIDIPDFWKDKAEYLSHIWVASGKKWIDPVKEANANRIAMLTGEKTFVQICAENGRDWSEVIDEMEMVQKYAESKGVILGGVPIEQKQTKSGA